MRSGRRQRRKSGLARNMKRSQAWQELKGRAIRSEREEIGHP
jgi:hypothetical protein